MIESKPNPMQFQRKLFAYVCDEENWNFNLKMPSEKALQATDVDVINIFMSNVTYLNLIFLKI
jgi:hypothetical protein